MNNFVEKIHGMDFNGAGFNIKNVYENSLNDDRQTAAITSGYH